MAVDRLSLRRRVARLGLLTAVLIGLTLALLLVALGVAFRVEPEAMADQLLSGSVTVFRPLTVVLAASAAIASLLRRTDRPVRRRRDGPGPVTDGYPRPLPREIRRLRRLTVTPLGPSAVPIVNEPEPPPGRLRTARPRPLHLPVLVPAHDEALTLAPRWTRVVADHTSPDKVVVVADNCTDDTAQVARDHRAQVFITVYNQDKKVGGLNQRWPPCSTTFTSRDVVMVMDADSIIVPAFLDTAMGRLEADPELIAVGRRLPGEPGAGLVGQLQRSEYTRSQRYIPPAAREGVSS